MVQSGYIVLSGVIFEKKKKKKSWLLIFSYQNEIYFLIQPEPNMFKVYNSIFFFSAVIFSIFGNRDIRTLKSLFINTLMTASALLPY
jgi:hypothetical protein